MQKRSGYEMEFEEVLQELILVLKPNSDLSNHLHYHPFQQLDIERQEYLSSVLRAFHHQKKPPLIERSRIRTIRKVFSADFTRPIEENVVCTVYRMWFEKDLEWYVQVRFNETMLNKRKLLYAVNAFEPMESSGLIVL